MVEGEIQNSKKNPKIWLILGLLCCSLILLTIGFGIGYIFTDKGCLENPLAYGIKQMNELNDDNFKCTCSSLKFGSFYINSSNMWINNNVNSKILPSLP